MSVEAGKFDAAKAVAALKNKHYPAETVKAIETASEPGVDAPVEDSAPAENTEAEAANS